MNLYQKNVVEFMHPLPAAVTRDTAILTRQQVGSVLKFYRMLSIFDLCGLLLHNNIHYKNMEYCINVRGRSWLYIVCLVTVQYCNTSPFPPILKILDPPLVTMQASKQRRLAVGEDHPTVITFDEKAVQRLDTRHN